MMKNIRTGVAKSVVLLVISLGLFWFSEAFSPGRFFEPETRSWILWMSYAKDLLQPFALYFLICLGERWLKNWRGRALLAFSISTFLEAGQALYYRFSPDRYVGTFDPMDIVMYSIGVGVAVLMDQKVFARRLTFWQQENITLHMAKETINARNFTS